MEGCGASVEAVRVDGGDLARVSAVLPAHLAPRLASFALQLLASDAGTEGAPIAVDRVGDASLYGVLPSVRDAVQLLGAGRALRVRQVDAAARPASARSAPAAAGPQLDPETGLALPGVDLVDDAGSTDSDGGGWDGGGAWLSAAEAAAARQVATVADAERVALFHAECDAAAVFRGEMPGWAAQQLTAIAAGRLDALVTAEKQLVDASLDLFTGDSAADGSE
ncbi:hypothetical protein FNF29_03287 [Cafeteria roenbergensis]|uniref:Uncharacterized protein n=1 Tax=Cafeteria roenbergensis TaxID=33653 RepID=A0A5A8CK57_CAFRO|nr:hypothetical protein FNF29_03287 [Cafeteria roenbergensis]|eukprot:KAA0153099.1 hypothetical protein FNF29_03287 [Cafeteria roenbergensis]